MAKLKRIITRRKMTKEEWELNWQRDKWVKLFSKPSSQEKCYQYWCDYRHLDDIKGLVNIDENIDVLDIGCGISTVLHWLPGRRIGIDPLALHYRQIYSYPKDVEIQKASGENLPFQNETFDVIFCSNCIDHMESPKMAISEVMRVLRPNGHYILTCETFAEDKGFRNEGHPHSMTTKKLKTFLKEFELIKHWQSEWYGLRNFVLGGAPTKQIENIFLLKKPEIN